MQKDVKKSIISKIFTKLAIGLIRFYQLCISPFLAPRCRFTPTCSSYGITALKKHGFFVGVWLTFKRIIRCHPLSEGGYDPVPEPPLKTCKHKRD